MADRSLVMTWGEVVRGREERALHNFNAVVELYGRIEQEGRIERFDVTLLAPNARLGGVMQLRGSAEQLAAVREDDEFQRVLAEASLIVDDLALVDGYVDAGIAEQMGMWQQAIARIPQMA